MIKEIIALIRKYGFAAVKTDKIFTIQYGTVNTDAVVVKSKNTDGKSTEWFTIIPRLPKEVEHEQTAFITGNNTNCLNIWLYETRKDLTADILVEFFGKIEELLNLPKNERDLLSTFVDPEDWQEIANVPDAYEDVRYKSHNYYKAEGVA